MSQVPVINNFSPATGPVGTSVTINGNNFSNIPLNNTVYFGAVQAQVIVASSNSVTAVVPYGASQQPISIKRDSLIAFSAQPFRLSFFSGQGANFTDNAFAPFVKVTDAQKPCFADFDNAGFVDIASIINGNKIAIFKNTGKPGAFAFASAVEYACPTTPIQVIAADFDGDGKLDLAVIGNGSAVVSLYRNNSTVGNILFDNQIYYSLGGQVIRPTALMQAILMGMVKQIYWLAFKVRVRHFQLPEI